MGVLTHASRVQSWMSLRADSHSWAATPKIFWSLREYSSSKTNSSPPSDGAGDGDSSNPPSSSNGNSASGPLPQRKSVKRPPSTIEKPDKPASGKSGPQGPTVSISNPRIPDDVPENISEVTALGFPRPTFPEFVTYLSFKEPEIIRTLQEIARSPAPYVGVFMTKAANTAQLSGLEMQKDLHEVGTLCTIMKTTQHDRTAQFAFSAAYRIRIDKKQKGPEKRKDGLGEKPADISPVGLGKVRITRLHNEIYDANDAVIKATQQALTESLREVMQMNKLVSEQVVYQLSTLNSEIVLRPGLFADFVAAVCQSDLKKGQAILEELSIPQRLDLALELVRKEIAAATLASQIQQEVEQDFQKLQRRYLLTEQLKKIKKELGLEKDDKEALLSRFRERLEELAAKSGGLRAEVQSAIDEEMRKLSHLEPQSPEFNVSRNYLDWLTSLPWGVRTTDCRDLKHVREVLNVDHYGLDDVKARVLEFIATGALRSANLEAFTSAPASNSSKATSIPSTTTPSSTTSSSLSAVSPASPGMASGKILCLQGPPGTGKTSIAHSIARALGRKSFRFSVGGLSDEAEIKGHRRTYIGAMPGKIVQCLKKTGVENPLIILDEIDKIGRGGRGDPEAALLELLDPEQNYGFLDHFLDVPVDLSSVLFVCTANVTDTIPEPLLDRMEVIRLSGYVQEEKREIARRYLIPAIQRESGTLAYAAEISDPALVHLIRHYCAENGVRNLRLQLEKIHRKLALAILESPATPEKTESSPFYHKVLDTADLTTYLGRPPYPHRRMYDEDAPAGVVVGLAWTARGGSTLYIEAAPLGTAHEGSSGRLKHTGRLGETMSESCTLSHTYARNFLAKHFPDNTYLHAQSVHLHCAEGAIKKDGPSAGITFVTALLSLALNKPVRRGASMTGEITLTGRVLPVGGIKEKIIAAREADITTVLLPEANRSDVEELPDYVKADINVHFVRDYKDVYDHVF